MTPETGISILSPPWWRQRKKGFFRIWLLLSVVWMIAATIFVPSAPHEDVTLRLYSYDNNEFDSFRRSCIRNSIELSKPNIVLYKGLSFTDFVNYFASIRPRPYTREEVLLRSNWRKQIDEFIKERALYDAKIESKFRKEINDWQKKQNNLAKDRSVFGTFELERHKASKPSRQTFEDYMRWEADPSTRITPPDAPNLACSSVNAITENILFQLALITIPPFALVAFVALALLALRMAIGICSKTFRWVVAGFQPASEAHENHPIQQPVIAPGHITQAFRPSFGRIMAALAVVAIVSIASSMVVSLTKPSIQRIVRMLPFPESEKARKLTKNSATSRDPRLAAMELKLHNTLPREVEPGVRVTDVKIDEQGLRWTYELSDRLLTSRQKAAARYAGLLRNGACQNQSVLEVVTNGFEVSYKLQDARGKVLETLTIAQCGS